MDYAWQGYRSPFVEFGEYVTDKEKSATTYAGYFYLRLLEMFEYKKLPETIPQDFLEYYLLRNGSCFITEVDSQLFAFIGNPGGEPDPYYRPTLYVCANPALNVSFEKKMWGDEGVFCINDSMWLGLDPMIQRYSYLMAENLISMRSSDILLRMVALLTAPDDRTKASAEQYLQDLIDGKLSAVGDNPFFEGIKMQSPASHNGSYLTQFIELHQYYKGSFYNEIGLRANFNMKREAIGVGEAALGEDSLLPLCDNMLCKRKEFVARVNELYGTEIEVDFSSIWKEKREEAELDMALKESEIQQSTVVNYQEEENENGGSENNEEESQDEDINTEEGDSEIKEAGEGETVSELHESTGDVDGDGSEESNEELEPAPDPESEEQNDSDITNNVEVNVLIGGDANEERTEDS